MKFYSLAEIDVTDPSWVADYLRNVTPMVERHGGRYLARTPKVEKIEGQRAVPQIVLIVEWPSREAIAAFYDSEEYRPYRERRVAGASNEFVIVPGEDVARMARIDG